MKKFSISDIERFSDIKAHTFRMWEHRYDFLKPKRTETKIRYYSLDEVRDLLNVTLLNKCGYRISKLARMEPLKISAIIEELTGNEEREMREINNLIIAMFSADIETFEIILDKSIVFWGIDSTIKKIIVPFMERIELLSYCDTSSETHFVVAAIRKKIISAIESVQPVRKPEKTALFFLPKEEHYDLMLLYMNYLAKENGYRTLYLGTNVSVENLKNIMIKKCPDLILTYFTPKHTFPIIDFAAYLNTCFPFLILIVSGFTGKLFQGTIPRNVRLINHEDLEEYLRYI